MSALTDGTVGVSITAGHIHTTEQPIHPTIGQQIVMGDGIHFMFHITPAIAKQWIETLTTIANETSN